MSLDLKSWLTGYALGLAGQPMPFGVASKPEPVAYLYNGVRLPALPEWDREKYPYAFICIKPTQVMFDPKPHLYCMETTRMVDDWEILNGINGLCYLYNEEEGNEWISKGTVTSQNTGINSKIIWSNHDIYYDPDGYYDIGNEHLAGTVFLAASEPAPVYE